MIILYLGDPALGTSSRHRAEALRRLGHNIRFVSTEYPGQSRWKRWVHYRSGYVVEARALESRVMAETSDYSYDLIWVDNGARVSRRLIEQLRLKGTPVVNYNLDDPTGRRDGNRWFTFRRAIPAYDVTIVVREENIPEYKKLGAKRVIRVFRSYDPAEHAPLPSTSSEKRKWGSEVVFVGTWMPGRGAFMRRLLDLGVPLSVYGGNWYKAPERSILAPHIRGEALYGKEYVLAVQHAKLALGLLSKGNRDQHTQRSAEIPFIGTAFCGERTREHQEMFSDGIEALLWTDADECALQCRKLLSDDLRRASVARAGRSRIIEMGLSNDEILNSILSEVSEIT